MRRLGGCALLSLVLAAACGDSDSSGGGGGGSTGGSGGTGASSGTADGGGGAAAQSFEFTVQPQVNGEAFSCGSEYAGVGTPPATVELLDFRLYIHDVRVARGDVEVPLELDQDGLWQLEDLVLLDFEDGSGSCSNGTSETNGAITGSIPDSSVFGAEGPDRLRFRVGVPASLNHGDTATSPSPLNLSGMFWDWLSGYKFVRIDARPVGANTSFLLHLASTDCADDGSGATCDRLNIAEFDLALPADGTILLDYAELVADVDLAADTGGAPGCMSGATDPECVAVFPQYGVDIDTGLPTGSPSWMSVK